MINLINFFSQGQTADLISLFFQGGTAVNFTTTGIVHLLAGVPLATAFSPISILGCGIIWVLSRYLIREVNSYVR